MDREQINGVVWTETSSYLHKNPVTEVSFALLHRDWCELEKSKAWKTIKRKLKEYGNNYKRERNLKEMKMENAHKELEATTLARRADIAAFIKECDMRPTQMLREAAALYVIDGLEKKKISPDMIRAISELIAVCE